MEEYLTADELAERIKDKKQTIYNRIYKREWIVGTHYVKPTPKKLLFKWSAIVSWLEGNAFQPHQPAFTSKDVEVLNFRESLKSEITI